MVPWTCFEMWRPCFPHGVHHYRIVLRGESYDVEKNGKLIGQFAELEQAQRRIEASAQRAEAWRARRMARVMAKTRAALAEEIRRDVPFERLFAAMFSVLQRRHERAGDGEFLKLNVSDPEQMLDEFFADLHGSAGQDASRDRARSWERPGCSSAYAHASGSIQAA